MSREPYTPFSKREIVLSCFLILAIALIFLFAITDRVSVESLTYDLAGHAFTLLSSVVCSVIATALLPKTLTSQSGDPEQFKKGIENLMRSAQAVVPYTYPDSNEANPDFNARMNMSISKTNEYIYFGDRALYLTKRLKKDIANTDQRLKITVFLADIREEKLFTSRREAYMQRERARNKTHAALSVRNIDDIINREKIDILGGLYALGQLQAQYNISIYLHKEIPFIRFEITDDLLAMSFLTQLSSGKRYPTTLLYENDSIFTKNFKDYISEVELRALKLSTSSLELESLMKLADEAGVKNCTEAEIKKHYESISDS